MRVDECKYSISSDYVRDLIHRDQNPKQKIKAMHKANTQVLKSEDVKDFDIKTFTKWALKKNKLMVKYINELEKIFFILVKIH